MYCVFMSWQIISIQGDGLVLEAFKRMKDNHIGGLPVVEGPNSKIVGNVSIRDIRHLLLRPELFSNFRYPFKPDLFSGGFIFT